MGAVASVGDQGIGKKIRQAKRWRDFCRLRRRMVDLAGLTTESFVDVLQPLYIAKYLGLLRSSANLNGSVCR